MVLCDTLYDIGEVEIGERRGDDFDHGGGGQEDNETLKLKERTVNKASHT